MKIIDSAFSFSLSLYTKAYEGDVPLSPPSLPMSFRQKLNAAVHERAEARPRLSSPRGQIVALGLNGRRVVVYFVPLTISLEGGGRETCSSVDQEMVMPHHPTTRVSVSPLLPYILYLRFLGTTATDIDFLRSKRFLKFPRI